jgi:hypothetical protein
VCLIRKLACHRDKRVTCTSRLGGVHSFMDIKHESVKVYAQFVGDACGESIVEDVHEHGFPCSDVTVEV